MNNKNKKGFTLIEILVVILIIGILAAIALPQYKYVVAKAKFTQLLTATKAINDAQMRYMLAKGEKCLDLSALDIDIEGGTYDNTVKRKIIFDWGDCQIAKGDDPSSIFCTLSNIGVRHFHYFSSEIRLCCASVESGEIGKRLCKSEFPQSNGIVKDTYCGVGGTIYY